MMIRQLMPRHRAPFLLVVKILIAGAASGRSASSSAAAFAEARARYRVAPRRNQDTPPLPDKPTVYVTPTADAPSTFPTAVYVCSDHRYIQTALCCNQPARRIYALRRRHARQAAARYSSSRTMPARRLLRRATKAARRVQRLSHMRALPA